MRIAFIIPLLVALMLPGKGQAGFSEFPNQGCDPEREWREFNGHCYRFVNNIFTNQPDTHSAMLSMCKRVGPNWYDGQGGTLDYTYLADIQSMEENEFVAEVMAGGQRTWLGAERQEDDTFSWIRMDDAPALSYTNWKPGMEPNNHNGIEDCVEINRGPPGMWNDIRCTIKLPAVCKYNIARYAARQPPPP